MLQAVRKIRDGFGALKRRPVLASAGAVVVLAGAFVGWKMPGASGEPASIGTPQRMRLLSQQQYLNTLAYVFGPDIKPNVNFAAIPRVKGLLGIGSGVAGVTDSQLEIYQKTAATVAAQVVGEKSRQFLIPCTPKVTNAADAECARTFLTGVGRLLYRRPMPDARLDDLVKNAGEAAESLHDFYQGLGVALEGLLISPNVLVVAEATENDPDRKGEQRLDAYSLATRLALFLWNAAPDDELLKSAGSGALLTRRGRAQQVDRMLASPRLEDGMRAFFDDMFAFDRFATLAKDALIYPSFSAETGLDAREQTLRTIVDHLLTRDGDYRDLFTTRRTFISPSLAALYELPANRGWQPYEFPADSPRAGLLAQVSFLALNSHPGRSSATLRGKALRETLLCQEVPRPPPNVDFSAVQNPDPGMKTLRQRVDFHLKLPACAGCHRITDPMGLAMEGFDGAGGLRPTAHGVPLENDTPIDTSGNLDGAPFTDMTGLGKAMHDNPQVPACLVKRVFTYGTGSPIAGRNRRLIEYFDAHFAHAGYRLPDLLRDIATSKAFGEIARPGTERNNKLIAANSLRPEPQLQEPLEE